MKCPWCGEEVTSEEYTKHLETCPKYKEKGQTSTSAEKISNILIELAEFSQKLIRRIIDMTKEAGVVTELDRRNFHLQRGKLWALRKVAEKLGLKDTYWKIADLSAEVFEEARKANLW